MLPDPALEARARTLGKELRCLVCQNQSIDDSDADLAHDLRRVVRDRLVAGDSDAQVLAYITERYGDFVLLKPPVKPADLAAVVRPARCAAWAAALLLVAYFRTRGAAAGDVPRARRGGAGAAAPTAGRRCGAGRT